MLATLGGTLALVLGLGILLLPLLVTELSRPRDSVWGALVLLLGLVLVTSADRLAGAPMLAVVSGGLLIGRLGGEVAQGRWRQLTEEERGRLGTAERWRSSLAQLGSSLLRLLAWSGGAASVLGGWLAGLRGRRPSTKRWVRPELPAAAVPPSPAAEGSGGAETDGQPPATNEESPAEAVAEPPGEEEPPAEPLDRKTGEASSLEREEPAELSATAAAPEESPAEFPEEPAGEATPQPAEGEPEQPLPDGDDREGDVLESDDLVVVSDFAGVEALLEQAVPPEASAGAEAGEPAVVTERDNPPLPPPQP